MLHVVEWYTISKTGQNYKNQKALMESVEKQIDAKFPTQHFLDRKICRDC